MSRTHRVQCSTGMQVSALRGFVGGSSFPNFGPEVVSPQMSFCSSYSSLQLLWVPQPMDLGSVTPRLCGSVCGMTKSSSKAATSRHGQFSSCCCLGHHRGIEDAMGTWRRQQIGLGLSGRYLRAGDNSPHTFSSDVCQMQTFQVKATNLNYFFL